MRTFQEFVKLQMIMLKGQVIVSGDKDSINIFQKSLKEKNKNNTS